MKKTELSIFIELILVFLAFYLPSYLWQDAAQARDPASFGLYMVQFLVLAIPQTLLLLHLLLLQHPLGEFGVHPLRAEDLWLALAIGIGMLGLSALLGLLVSRMPENLQRIFSQGFRFRLSEPRLVPLVVLFGLAAGYREELFFRAYLLTRFGQLRVPAAIGALLGSLLFAAGHLYQGLTGFAVALVQGLFFSAMFLKLRSLHCLALAHGLYNVTVLIVTLLSDTGLPLPPGVSTF